MLKNIAYIDIMTFVMLFGLSNVTTNWNVYFLEFKLNELGNQQ